MCYFLLLLFLLGTGGCSLHCSPGSKTNALITKVLHHKKVLGDKIVFMSLEPLHCNRVNNISQKGYDEFFLPNAWFESDDITTVIQNLNQSPALHYSMTVEKVYKPTKGLKVAIQYDPTYIDCTQEYFDAISTQKGIIFSFHNKAALEMLRQKTDPILRSASLSQKPTIVIDCGHGGSDTGARGFYNAQEKDITLAIGKKVAHLLKKNNFNVLLSRSNDSFVPLDARSSYANQQGADAFVSLHANSAPNKAVHGLETYWTSLQTLKSLVSQDAYTPIFKEQDKQNHRFAQHMHEKILSIVNAKKSLLVDRNVRSAVSQVLLGADMLATLIELGYITNEQETHNLLAKDYQDLLAFAIGHGIISFFDNHSN